MRYLKFNHQDEMPALGLGTWLSKPGEVYDAILHALQIGYRHIDCAHIYGNEKEIGAALQKAFADGMVQRSDLWITSKLWCDAHPKAAVLPALKHTLEALQLDYLDLYLIHWPIAYEKQTDKNQALQFISLDEIPVAETWEGMIEAQQEGLTRHIGVSNFSVKKLQQLLDNSSVPPALNQVELHPYLQQKALWKFCKENNIHLTAYSPLGTAKGAQKLAASDLRPLLQNETINNIAQSLDCTAAQVLIQWSISRGTAVIPKSVNPERLTQNFEAASVVLTNKHMQILEQLDCHYRFVDGTFWVVEGGPYTLKNLWDE